MDESQEILLSSLRSSGITLPDSISSIGDITPDALVSICAQFLILVDDSNPPFPSCLPVSTTDRFKICADLADAVKSSGYRGDLSFNQFLYPSNEDLYKLVRFLVERLAESFESKKDAHIEEGTHKDGVRENQRYKARPRSAISPVGLKEEPSVSIHIVADDSVDFESYDKENSCSKETEETLSEELRNPKEVSFNAESEQRLTFLEIQSLKVKDEVESLQIQENMLVEANHNKRLEFQNLGNEPELLKAAADMVFDCQHSVEFYIGKLDEQVEEKRCNIMKLKSQRNAPKQRSVERKSTLGRSIHSLEPGVQGKLDQLREIEQEIEATISKINFREAEHTKLFEELEKLPKLPPRRSYIQRITEITKSSRKQDADIDRILKETRELQVESNSVQERLARTYAVVDETVFREAKKDAVGRQVYRLLTSIHDSFEQISEKILATDRARREAAEHEAKLAVLSSRNYDISKLQSDLDSIRKENDLLDQQLRHGSST